jgi:hypothetical protein
MLGYTWADNAVVTPADRRIPVAAAVGAYSLSAQEVDLNQTHIRESFAPTSESWPSDVVGGRLDRPDYVQVSFVYKNYIVTFIADSESAFGLVEDWAHAVAEDLSQ